MKPMGVKFPTIKAVRNSVNANPDGFSMAYNENGVLVTYRTLDAEAFMDKYREVISTHCHLDTALMLHMRIATHGSVRVDNCHCWRGNVLGDEVAFAHNGILSIRNMRDKTDSETFLRHYAESCRDVYEFLDTVESNIGSSKFGFINGRGHMMRFGNFIEDKGVLFSNRSYMGNTYASMADPRLWRARVI